MPGRNWLLDDHLVGHYICQRRATEYDLDADKDPAPIGADSVLLGLANVSLFGDVAFGPVTDVGVFQPEPVGADFTECAEIDRRAGGIQYDLTSDKTLQT